MISNLTKNRTVKTLILVAAIVSIIIIIVFYVKATYKPVLKIIVSPTESIITITNNNQSLKNTFNSELKQKFAKDLYNIKIEKDGYITEERQIMLDKNINLEITLFPSSLSDLQKSYRQEIVVPIFSKEGFQNGKIYGINKKTGNLIQFESGNEKIIYQGKVKDYSIKNITALVLDESNLSEINVINLTNFNIQKIVLKELSPIISVTLSEDEKIIYFLSEFGISKKISNLNTISLNGQNHKKIIDTGSQSVEYLTNDLIVLFTENHEVNNNFVKIFDLKQNKELLSETTNNYNVSPDLKYLFLHRKNEIKIINLDDFNSQSKTVLDSSRSTWKNNNTLYLFRNSDNNIYYSKVTIEPFMVTPFALLIENSSLQNVFGFIENRVYMQDYNEKIFSIEIKDN